MKTLLKIVIAISFTGLVACGDETPTTTQAPEKDAVAEDVSKETAAVPAKGKQADRTAIFLRYDVIEPGVDPYQTRIVITDEYMRIDDDDNPRNFVLVDREQQIVYSVSDANDGILVVPKQPVDIAQPFEIKYTEQRVAGEQAPTIDGKQTVRYIFEANGLACYDTIVAEGLLPKATLALTEYLGILAGQHASTLQQVPADLINACDMGMNIFNPGMHLVHGLPISEHDPATGYQRQLVEFDDDYDIEPALFVLPEGFGRFSISDLQSGGVPAQSAE